MSTVHLFNCAQCGAEIQRSTNQVASKRYKVRQGQSSELWFCNHSCSRSHGNALRPSTPPPSGPGNQYARKYDKEFAFYMHRVRNDKRRDLKVLTEDLHDFESHIKDLWDGKCHYTGIALELRPYTSYGKADTFDPFTTASLDRIDSDAPYMIGNVVWTSTFLNRARGNMTYERFKEGLATYFSGP